MTHPTIDRLIKAIIAEHHARATAQSLQGELYDGTVTKENYGQHCQQEQLAAVALSIASQEREDAEAVLVKEFGSVVKV